MGPSDYVIGGATVAGVAVLFALAAFRRRGAGPESRQSRRDIEAAIREHAAVAGDIERLMKELESLAERVGSQIDTKTRSLEQALVDAEQRIRELHAIAGSTTGQNPVVPAPVNIRELTMARPEPLPEEECGRYGAIYALADQGRTPLEIARQTGHTAGEVELILNLRGPRRSAAIRSVSVTA